MFQKIKTSGIRFVAPVALVAFIAMILACTSSQPSNTDGAASGTHAILVDSIPTQAPAQDMAMN